MSLAGTYRLSKCEVLWSDGEVEQPYGRSPEGILVYTRDGYVTGHLMRRGVPQLETSARRANPEDLRVAFLGYLGYFGTYTVDETAGTVTHHVLGSWHPNWVGTNQVRHFRREKESIVIETPSIQASGRAYRTRLVWKCVAAG